MSVVFFPCWQMVLHRNREVWGISYLQAFSSASFIGSRNTLCACDWLLGNVAKHHDLAGHSEPDNKLKWFSGLKGRGKKIIEVLYWELDVISVAAPAELFSTNDCNYTVSTARVIRLRRSRILVLDHRATWWSQSGRELLHSSGRVPPSALTPSAVTALVWKQSRAAPAQSFQNAVVSPIPQPALSPFKQSQLLKNADQHRYTPPRPPSHPHPNATKKHSKGSRA